jgi:hypothetical protein
VFCSYLALLLKCELEERMRAKELQWEWAEVIRGLDALQEVETHFAGKGYVLRSELVSNASEAIRGAGVSVPPPVRPIEQEARGEANGRNVVPTLSSPALSRSASVLEILGLSKTGLN